MASDAHSGRSEASPPCGREPLTPAKRKRLQKLFEHASKQMAQESHDYATELFTECVLGDPSNLIYVQNYIGNLQRKYNNNKTGSKLAQFKERGARSAVKKALAPEYAAASFERTANYPSRWETPTFVSYCWMHLEICGFTAETPYALIGDLLLTREHYREAGERMAAGIVEELRGR